MTDAEFVAWQSATVAALLDVQARTTVYLDRRSGRGTRTSTDIAMERDQLLYADLLDALGELKSAHDVSLTSGAASGLLHSYDASQGAGFTPDPDDPDDDTIDFYAPKAQPKP